MKKAMITTATVFALVLNAGMSMAGPLRDHGQRGHAQDVRSTVSQVHTHAETKSKTHQTTIGSGHSSGLASQPSVNDNCDACTDAWS
ncbi:hypothetical protein [Ruegeria sp. EL01]|jgi:hypothetical protein|uniref:hypothetical protein n=1 Tax=Ruegeria sp. EL01 TaxID=2107578 RepID=UPI000EA806A8|nr:hypothetical protein [Ruegeria sp. EL01]